MSKGGYSGNWTHQPNPRLNQAQEAKRFTAEIAKCSFCLVGTLDFETNLFGGVNEVCQKCHRCRPMQRAQGVALKAVDPVETWKCPEKCGRTVSYAGVGPRRRRCVECQNERYKANATEQRKNEQKTEWKASKGRAA